MSVRDEKQVHRKICTKIERKREKTRMSKEEIRRKKENKRHKERIRDKENRTIATITVPFPCLPPGPSPLPPIKTTRKTKQIKGETSYILYTTRQFFSWIPFPKPPFSYSFNASVVNVINRQTSKSSLIQFIFSFCDLRTLLHPHFIQITSTLTYYYFQLKI